MSSGTNSASAANTWKTSCRGPACGGPTLTEVGDQIGIVGEVDARLGR